MDVVERWNGPIQSLIRSLSSIHIAYDKAYSKLPQDIKKLFERHNDYLNDKGSGPLWHLMDYLFCMFPYRDLQYGFKGQKKDTENLKLGWIALHIAALNNLIENKEQLRQEILSKVRQCERKDIDFFENYILSTIAELSAIYVYLREQKVILPFGFMQHGIKLTGKSGPALGDFIEVSTMSFVNIKSSRDSVSPQEIVNLMVSTRLPSAFIVPRYGIKDKKIDNSKIVLDRFEPQFSGKNRYPRRKESEYLHADIKSEHKELIGSIRLLQNNAKRYMSEKLRLKSG